MTWFWIAGIITLFFSLIALIVTTDDGSLERLKAATVTFIVTGIVTGVLAFGMNLACMNVGYTSKQHESYVTDIVNLHDGSETEGSGGLFYFVVETYPRFTYYVRNTDGSFSPEYVDDDYDHRVRVFEDGTNNPRLDCMRDYLVKGHSNEWSFFGPSIDTNSCHDYIFHVPPGSVSRQFSLGGVGNSSGGN